VSVPQPGNFLILHGWQNERPPGHWQRWLAHTLSDRGHAVCYPQLPRPHRPRLAGWKAAIADHLDRMPPDGRTVICHSLACVAWLHLAASDWIRPTVERILFVAPPSEDYLLQNPVLKSFAVLPERDCVATSSVTKPRLVCSDNDPYCPPSEYADYAKAFEIDAIVGEGHFDLIAGYGSWQSILDWCEDPGTTIHGRLPTGPRRNDLGLPG
jgi:uncharacterized protein